MKHWLQVRDLRTGKITALPGPWIGPTSPSYLALPTYGRTFLVTENDDQRQQSTTYAVTLPQGKRKMLEVREGGTASALWDQYALLPDYPGGRAVVSIYQLPSGQRVQQLKVPEGH